MKRIEHNLMQECGAVESSAENTTLIKIQFHGSLQSAVEGKSAENEYTCESSKREFGVFRRIYCAAFHKEESRIGTNLN